MYSQLLRIYQQLNSERHTINCTKRILVGFTPRSHDIHILGYRLSVREIAQIPWSAGCHHLVRDFYRWMYHEETHLVYHREDLVSPNNAHLLRAEL